jgi:hypothetical protein
MHLRGRSACGRSRIHGHVSVAFEDRFELRSTMPHVRTYAAYLTAEGSYSIF